jgi:Raf kinase inhibitor-like YbhB/YbcL family protein
VKQQHLSPFLCAAAFVLAVGACGGDETTTPNPNTVAGAGGATAGTPATTAGTSSPGAAGTSAGTTGAGRSGAAGTGTATAGTGTGTGAAGTGAAGTGTAGTSAAGTGAAAGAGGAAAGSGGAAAGSGATAGAGGGAAMGGMLGGALMYTSAFTMGTTIPTTNKCPMSAVGGGTGDNKSPALTWKGGPADTKSFAVVLFDTQYNMLHWVLWDIPATVNALPEGLAAGYELTTPPGAHQAASMGMNPHAYYGPCSSGSLAGTYEYRLYALKTEKLMLTESSTGAQAQTAVEAAKLEMVVFSAKPM